MGTFVVEVTQISKETVEVSVEAESKDQAKEIVEQRVWDAEVSFGGLAVDYDYEIGEVRREKV